MLCLNESLIYFNYSILYSYGQINMSVCLCLSACLVLSPDSLLLIAIATQTCLPEEVSFQVRSPETHSMLSKTDYATTGGEAMWTLFNVWIRPNECHEQFKIGSGTISNKIYYYYYTRILKQQLRCCCKSNCHNFITLYKKKSCTLCMLLQGLYAVTGPVRCYLA